MDIPNQYTSALKKFVQDHLSEDPALLLFKYQGKTDFDLKSAVQQISARQRSKSKLPGWALNPDLLFPAGISLEQSSSEETAKFKAELFAGRTFLDLTTGFGVDAFYISQQFEQTICVERQEELAEIVKHNFGILTTNKFEIIIGDGLKYLMDTDKSFDLIYLDPARRGGHNQKLYRLQDCEPDVVSMWPLLRQKSFQVLIKASPMLDIKGVIQELQDIQKIWILAVKNEVKEILLFWEKKTRPLKTEIIAVNLSGIKKSVFKFNFEEEELMEVNFGEVETYLIEPNAAILKAGAFKLFAYRFQLKKLHPNSHLYTCSKYPEDIPGRVFKVNKEVKADKKAIKTQFPSGKVNVITRNFYIKADELKKKYHLKDGGEDFLIGTMVGEKYRLFLCKPANEV